MRGLSPILNLLTVLTLLATGLLVLVFAVLFLAPGIVPSFLRQPTEPAQVAAITPYLSPTPGILFPTLPPEWTATPSPQPSATETPFPTDTATATPAATDTPIDTAVAAATAAEGTTAADVTPTASATATIPAGDAVQVKTLANVRSGPGTNYPILVGLPAGATAAILGRNSDGDWFKISVADTPQGAGWISALVVTYGGDVNSLPILTAPPPPVPTPAPPTATFGPPTQTPLPNVGSANGLQALSFSMRKTVGAIGEDLFFDFKVINTTNTSINNYGILAAHTDQGVTADSWHAPLQPGQTLTWDDHINFPNTGTYQVYLGICYASHDACKTGGAPWSRLSPSVTVTIHS